MPRVLFLLALGIVLTDTAGCAATPTITRDEIIKDAHQTADAQLKALQGKFSTGWVWGVMETGYAGLSHVSPDGPAYGGTLTAWANQAEWTPPTSKSNGLVHADDFCIGQTFLDLYVSHPAPSEIEPLRKRLDLFVDHIKAEPPNPPKLTWYWCDALFMAPPALARMSAITQDQKYINAMDAEYWRTVALLYDRDEHLFYRDSRFLTKKDINGKKVFWARGNGWVLAGLARTLQYMPADYASRPKYIALFKDMAAKLSTLQSPDGTWPASLIDPRLFPGPETSGTSLFCYGIAWGINNDLLDRTTYLPIVARAWIALINDRRSDYLPGFVQGVGFEPRLAQADGTQLYTTGSLLLDAVELLKLAPIEMPRSLTKSNAAD